MHCTVQFSFVDFNLVKICRCFRQANIIWKQSAIAKLIRFIASISLVECIVPFHLNCYLVLRNFEKIIIGKYFNNISKIIKQNDLEVSYNHLILKMNGQILLESLTGLDPESNTGYIIVHLSPCWALPYWMDLVFVHTIVSISTIFDVKMIIWIIANANPQFVYFATVFRNPILHMRYWSIEMKYDENKYYAVEKVQC